MSMVHRLSFIAFAIMALCLCACIEDDVKRGNEALLIGDYDRAIQNFSKVLDQEPSHRDARYGLALSYFSKAEDAEQLHIPTFDLWQRTASEFSILSKIDSSSQVDANYSTCLFYLARASMSKGEDIDILPLLNKSIELDGENHFSMNLKALVLEKNGNSEDIEQAKNLFIHVITDEPQFVSAYINLGNLYWEKGDIESAWDTWSMGLKKEPQNSALLRWTKIAEDSLKAKVISGEL